MTERQTGRESPLERPSPVLVPSADRNLMVFGDLYYPYPTQAFPSNNFP